MASNYRSASNESGHADMPGLMKAPMASTAAIDHNARLAKANGKVTKTDGLAIFIVSGEADAGVVQAVYGDLRDGNKDANIEVRESEAPHICINAATDDDALALLRSARELADAYISGEPSKAKAIFVEPPPERTTTDFRVEVHVIDSMKCACAKLEYLPGAQDTASHPAAIDSTPNRYEHKLSQSLLETLRTAANLHTSLTLRVQFGHYLLQTYKKGEFTLEQFETMVKRPRATGSLETRLGKEPFARSLSIEAAMRAIQAAGSPCVPSDNQIPTSADVTPAYAFECWHEGDRYEVDLDVITVKNGLVDGPLKFNMSQAKMIPKDAQVPRFNAISIGIGRKLDWKVVAMPGNEAVNASATVKRYLETEGKADMRDSPNDFRCFPAVHLPGNSALAKKLKPVALKSTYRFLWKQTGYVLQFTIYRRWQTIQHLKDGAQMETDFDITVYADNWDKDSRAKTGETVGKLWGADLQNLLRDEAGDGLGRVQGLVKTILEIRDFFEGSNTD
ncbi:hypothetical protein F4808DRAFT_411794 [Astrocystis sublimbata]|nr:hypothetical protein F4808DRAFT_411794 [Astrocystis sublimbata]